MIDKMIIDADLCIKLGGSNKYRYLYDILPMIAKRIYIHTYAHGEVMAPSSAVNQPQNLIWEGKVELVNENTLDSKDRAIFTLAYRNLERVMIDPHRPNKNKGEVCSLAYAKAKSIPVFATDEMKLQPIIDSQLNTGMNDITCIRIIDIIEKAHSGEIAIPRKICKALWLVSGKKKETFDKDVWPIERKNIDK